MDFESLANSRAGIELALGVSRATPPFIGHAVARLAAHRLAADRDSAMVRAIRGNQWMSSGMTLTGPAPDAAVEETLAMSGRFLYDIYHLPRRPKALLAKVAIDETAERFVRASAEGPRVIAVVHLSNFDLVARALGLSGWQVQVLSIANPNGGYEAQNEMRTASGLEVTPVSMESLKRASRRLADGGSVLTGIDRPLPGADLRPRFFGRPAPLPVLHVRLAMRAKAPVVVASGILREDGRYALQAFEPIQMEGSVKNEADVLANAERVLRFAEEFITRSPRQWAMPHAVWPDISAP